MLMPSGRGQTVRRTTSLGPLSPDELKSPRTRLGRLSKTPTNHHQSSLFLPRPLCVVRTRSRCVRCLANRAIQVFGPAPRHRRHRRRRRHHHLDDEEEETQKLRRLLLDTRF